MYLLNIFIERICVFKLERVLGIEILRRRFKVSVDCFLIILEVDVVINIKILNICMFYELVILILEND